MSTSNEIQNRKEWDSYTRQMRKLGSEAIQEAVAETINNVASYAHVEQQKTVRRDFTVRTPYTINSFKYYKASPKANINKINAVTGTVSPYLPIQETGGTVRPKSGSHVPIPTLKARGGRIQNSIRRKYYAGTSNKNIFVGKPKPKGGSRPAGVWE